MTNSNRPLRLLILEDDDSWMDIVDCCLRDHLGHVDILRLYSEGELIAAIENQEIESFAPDLAILDVIVRWDHPVSNHRRPLPNNYHEIGGRFEAGTRCKRAISRSLNDSSFPVILYTVKDRHEVDIDKSVVYLSKDSPLDALPNRVRAVTDYLPNEIRHKSPITDSLEQSIVISVHGIRTRGKWQKDLTSELNKAGLLHAPLDFGFFSSLQLLLPWSRRKKIDWFREEYTRICVVHQCSRPSVVAHSFGTYLIARSLQIHEEMTFDRIIFCGSIVDREYDWHSLIHPEPAIERSTIATPRVNHIFNDYGKLDIWARIAIWFVADAGNSGFNGFSQECGNLWQKERLEFRHSDYFYALNYEKNWVPFLLGNEPQLIPTSRERSLNWRFSLVAFVVVIVLLAAAAFFFWLS